MNNIRLKSAFILIFSILAQFFYTDFPLQKNIAYASLDSKDLYENEYYEDLSYDEEFENDLYKEDNITTPSIAEQYMPRSFNYTIPRENFSYDLREENGEVVIRAQASGIERKGHGYLLLFFDGAEYVYGWSNLERGKSNIKYDGDYYNYATYSTRNTIDNPHVMILNQNSQVERFTYAESISIDYYYEYENEYETWKLVVNARIKKPSKRLTGFAVESSFETDETEYMTLHDRVTHDLRDVVSRCHSYNIYFNSEDGQVIEQKVPYGGSINLPNPPQKEGYVFVGWNTNSDGSGVNISDAEQIKAMAGRGENLSFYPVWRAVNYIVAYNANGGTGSMESSQFTYNTNHKLQKNKFVRDGYTYTNWNTKADGTGISYQNGQEVGNLSSIDNHIFNLYAVWHANMYKANLSLEKGYFIDGSSKKKSIKVDLKYGEQIGKLPVPTLEDYRFDGWYFESELINKIEETSIFNIASDTKFYPKWSLYFIDNLNGTNKRAGADGIIGTDDDNFYTDGADGIAGTKDDIKISAGKDGKLGTKDDYYMDGSNKVYAGKDEKYGTADDYYLEESGKVSHTKGEDLKFGTDDDKYYYENEKEIYAGKDAKYGTADDYYLEDDKKVIHTKGEDLKFGTKDDKYYYENEKEIFVGKDKKYGTADDYYLEENGKVSHTRGEDLKFGTDDDKYYYENEKEIFVGKDEKYGTADDYHLEENGKVSHTRGEDLKFGTDDDKYYYENEKEIYAGKDKKYKTADDYYLEENGKISHTRGEDLKFETKDDKYYYENDKEIYAGKDKKYGTADDYYLEENGKVSHTRGEDLKFGTDDDSIKNIADDVSNKKEDLTNSSDLSNKQNSKPSDNDISMPNYDKSTSSGKNISSNSGKSNDKFSSSSKSYVDAGPGVKDKKNIIDEAKEIIEAVKNIKKEDNQKDISKDAQKKKEDNKNTNKKSNTLKDKSSKEESENNISKNNKISYRKNRLQKDSDIKDKVSENTEKNNINIGNDVEKLNENKDISTASDANINAKIYESRIEKNSFDNDSGHGKESMFKIVKSIKEKPVFVLSLFIMICALPLLLFFIAKRRKKEDEKK